MKLIIASNNEGKIKEFKKMLTPLGYEPVSMREAGINIDIAEDGTTFSENAHIKAKTIYDMTHTPVLADDSGLSIEFLGGAPGIYSARWAGEGATGRDMVNKLLSEMRGVTDREAEFVSSVVMVFSEDDYIVAEGRCKGIIAEAPAGDGGFGYDPVFYVPECGKTFAELSLEEKNKISHRALAIRDLKKKLAER